MPTGCLQGAHRDDDAWPLDLAAVRNAFYGRELNADITGLTFILTGLLERRRDGAPALLERRRRLEHPVDNGRSKRAASTGRVTRHASPV